MTTARAATIVFEPEGVRIPRALKDLRDFRRWLYSGDFPERGRFDWIGGDLEVDMSPEELNTHATPKMAIAGDLRTLVEGEDRGVVLVDRMRVTCPAADLSVEPDVVVVLFESLEQGRVRLARRKTRGGERCTEIQGAPDLIVECVSASSRAKDCVRLRDRYARAGVPEYWIVDASEAAPSLTLLRRGRTGYREMKHAPDGYVRSPCLHLEFRLEPFPRRSGIVRYRLASR